MTTEFDLCVIGGGINGAGIARDAAGRGQRVLLIEAADLASATSSASSKMLHGGLRYLEYYEFKLVRESLREREILLRIAPHIVFPMDFVLPCVKGLRPAWMLRAGLFLYDHLAGRKKLKRSFGLRLARHPFGAPLKKEFLKGFCYADGWLDDARLVVLNAMDAQERGATVLTRTSCTGLKVQNASWHITLRDNNTGLAAYKTARIVINAAGPWAHKVLEQSNLVTSGTPGIRLVKGSHIVIPRLYKGDHAYLLQQSDRRVVFVWPYGKDFNYIGTTDIDYQGEPRDVKIDDAEKEYLCNAVNSFFANQISSRDIIADWSGVRPLLDDGHGAAQSVTRDFKLVRDDSHGAPLLSVFGGKITTYRILAEQAVDHVIGGEKWTSQTSLPGGDLPNADFAEFLRTQEARYPWIPGILIERYARQYGTRMQLFLKDATDHSALGAYYGDGLYEAEVRYLIQQEWARTAEDILKRRTKLYLQATTDTVENLANALPALLREPIL